MSEPSTDPTPTDPGSADPASGEPLGDAGKRALDAERQARKDAESALKAATTKHGELEAELSRLRRSNAATKGTDLDALKSEIRGEFEQKLLKAEIRAAATGRFANPAVAERLLDDEVLAKLRSDDSDGIKAALEDLLKREAYLAAKPAGPTPWGDVGGGLRDTNEPEPRSAQERLARAYANPRKD